MVALVAATAMLAVAALVAAIAAIAIVVATAVMPMVAVTVVTVVAVLAAVMPMVALAVSVVSVVSVTRPVGTVVWRGTFYRPHGAGEGRDAVLERSAAAGSTPIRVVRPPGARAEARRLGAFGKSETCKNHGRAKQKRLCRRHG
jgi:hypothetical protein